MNQRADVADAVVAAIHSGDIAGLRRFLTEYPGVASVPLGGRYKSRTPLHVVADWPGYFPNGPAVVRLLVDAGADPNASQPGEETPLHWAASSDDWHVALALIVAGADLKRTRRVDRDPARERCGLRLLGRGSALVARGADVDQSWIAASLGLLDRLAELLGDSPSSQQVSQGFWHACSGGQRRAAEYLLGRGADLGWVPDYAKGTPLDAAISRGTQRDNLIGWLREHHAQSKEPDD